MLQQRGLMWDDYAVPGGTLRENLHRRPGKPFLPEEHAGAQFRYPNLKKRAANSPEDVSIDAIGDVTFDRRVKSEVTFVDGASVPVSTAVEVKS